MSNATHGFFYNASTQRYQNFESTTPGDVITILHAPSLESSSVDHAIGHSPFYWSYDAAAEGLSRSEPGFRTAPLVGRFDLSPNAFLAAGAARLVGASGDCRCARPSTPSNWCLRLPADGRCSQKRGHQSQSRGRNAGNSACRRWIASSTANFWDASGNTSSNHARPTATSLASTISPRFFALTNATS